MTQYSRRSLNAFFCSPFCACIYDLAEPYLISFLLIIAAGQLVLGDASEGSSSDSEVALRNHEHLDTLGGTRHTEVSRPDVSRAGSPTGSYPDESRRKGRFTLGSFRTEIHTEILFFYGFRTHSYG